MEQVAVMWNGFINHAYWSSHHTVTYYIYAPDTTNHKNHQSPLLILPTLMPPISLPLWRSFLLYNLDSISVSNSWTVEQKHWPILDRCSFATDEVPINEHSMTAWTLSYTYKGSRSFFSWSAYEKRHMTRDRHECESGCDDAMMEWCGALWKLGKLVLCYQWDRYEPDNGTAAVI